MGPPPGSFFVAQDRLCAEAVRSLFLPAAAPLAQPRHPLPGAPARRLAAQPLIGNLLQLPRPSAPLLLGTGRPDNAARIHITRNSVVTINGTTISVITASTIRNHIVSNIRHATSIAQPEKAADRGRERLTTPSAVWGYLFMPPRHSADLARCSGLAHCDGEQVHCSQ
jgi:hypothetical protein